MRSTWGWVMLVGAAACGSPSVASVDASRPQDTASDSSALVDATVYDFIRVRVYSEVTPGSVAVGIRVLFTAPDQTTVTVLTGADGVAESRSAPNTTVTVIQPGNPTGTAFSSFVALQPGDMVVAGPQKPVPQAGSNTVTTIMPPISGGMFYTVVPSCPFDAIVNPNVATEGSLSARTPCSNAAEATLVGRAYDSTHLIVLGVSILDNVDLTALTQVTMPAYEQSPASLTATLTNIPSDASGVEWNVFYYLGTESTSILESAGASALENGTVNLATTAFPAGNETTFVLEVFRSMHDGAFSEFHTHRPMLATAFALDAQTIIKAVDAGTADHDMVTWTESTVGADPTTVTVGLSWGDTHGIMYAPYNGPSLSLHTLPPEIQPANSDTPTLTALQYFATGRTYQDDLLDLDERIGATDVRMLSVREFWRTSFPLDPILL